MKTLIHRRPLAYKRPLRLPKSCNHFGVPRDLGADELSRALYAAVARVEDFFQIAILRQTVRAVVCDPCIDSCVWKLPIGPAVDDAALAVTVDGEPFDEFTFKGGANPFLIWWSDWENLPIDRLVVAYTAGFGDTLADIPEDLREAILDETALVLGRSGRP